MIGGVAALLLAPEKGEVTRKRLKEGARELMEHGETVAGEIRGAAEGVIKTATGTGGSRRTIARRHSSLKNAEFGRMPASE